MQVHPFGPLFNVTIMSRHVSRPVAACSRCRTAKIKCDGKLPACSACERVGKAISCSGASDEFAKGKERSYVASLEGYCEKLEKKISQMRARSTSLSAEGDGIPREMSITSVSSERALGPAHRREVSDIDDLVGDFGFLSVNATSRDFHGITSSTSFANLLLSVALVDSSPPSSPYSLPARHEATPLLQYYFDNIFVQLPFFIETSFWTSVDAVYQSGGRFAKPFDHWMLRMVLAIASASLSYHHNDKSHQRAWALVSEALTYAEEVLRPGSISGIQAILLLAQYSFVDPVRFRSWYLIGMAVKVAIDLGLHQDPPAEVLTNPDRLDIRRRVFHSIYCLDRGLSPAMQRTYSFSDGSVNVALPSITAPGALLEQTHIFLRSPGPALHIVKIRQILSAGYQEMHYSGRDPSPQPLVLIWTLCWRAREWFQQCPKNAPNHFSLLYRLELLYTIIILISPSHRYPILHDYSKALLFDRCMDYISQIHQVLENPSALPFLTYLDIQRVHQVGRIFVNVLSDNYDMLISAAVPAPPPVPAGTPEPPVLGDEDLFNCHARAIRCLSYIRDMLKYCDRKWDIHGHLEQFEDESASIEKTLMDGSVGYMSSQEIYCQDLLSGMPLAGDAYSGYHIGL
ncbi:transcriptional regulator family: Fungal Specific TF [Penicillium roqueforti]|uniref:transcriptional regulator family: Fungal Specific TF n=1 Tax=Penicillium roqueforti TaxID=5082 RepID=UPI00190BDDF6|nr:transcriptional regulator family: Fungal Specific TF [Penicillium roqueforti]KAF9250021.1 transcriptional regulator family: Fungal Specific TF [Penicillium roqueforti]KAI1831575.1 transcriptional regulator family: Fungal Specific TF [Penicillium roqueforti]KAI2679472.1 transcriptional regulator family: Fungal Specific TF [Penicillium roqueforti]KAI2684586.1 transcriptional regulator family: Fungal Specific TF [Penicillium roqueforti]KAI2701136.1 transcriptional regulator family: Fungal Spec